MSWKLVPQPSLRDSLLFPIPAAVVVAALVAAGATQPGDVGEWLVFMAVVVASTFAGVVAAAAALFRNMGFAMTAAVFAVGAMAVVVCACQHIAGA